MDKYRINIAVIEPSHIIYEGLSNILHRYKKDYYLYRINDLVELSNSIAKENFSFVIINPSAIHNKLSDFYRLKNNYPGVSWIALIYSFYDNELISKFDKTLSITDTLDQINQKFDTSVTSSKNSRKENLSEREIDVLTQMVKGLSNKEIADALNISPHTVISHRKNITEKTGIKSLSGLTIYAISKKIIPLDYTSL